MVHGKKKFDFGEHKTYIFCEIFPYLQFCHFVVWAPSNPGFKNICTQTKWTTCRTLYIGKRLRHADDIHHDPLKFCVCWHKWQRKRQVTRADLGQFRVECCAVFRSAKLQPYRSAEPQHRDSITAGYQPQKLTECGIAAVFTCNTNT